MTIPFFKEKSLQPSPIDTFDFADYSGGLNNKSSQSQLKPNQAWDLLNMCFYSDYLMEKRQGTHPIDELTLDEPITYLDVYKPINNPEVLIRATNTRVYAGTTKICDVQGEIQGVNYTGNYYFVDGFNYFVYDGLNVYKIKDAPNTTLASEVTSGSTSFVFTNWDDRIKVGQTIQIEGVEGFDILIIATVNKNTKVVTTTTASTVTYPQNTFVRLYKPKDTTYFEGTWQTDETLKWKWYEPCDHELNDNYKGENYLPKNCMTIQYDSERLYLAGDKDNPHQIYISDINNPFYYPVALSMQCPPNGDKIIDLVYFDNFVVTGRTDDIHVIGGNTNNVTMSNYFELRKFDTHTGFASKNNAKLANNYMFFVGSDMNVYAMHTPYNNADSLATQMLNKDTIDLSKPPLNFTSDDIKRCPAIYYKDEYMIAIKGKVIVYNYIYRGWTFYSGINANCFCIKDDQLLIGTTTGKVMSFGGAYNDDGLPINAYYRMGQQTLGTPINYKDFLELHAVSHAYEDYESSMKVTAMVDYDEAISFTDIDNKVSKFGTAKFGDKLVSQNIAQSDYMPIDLRGRVLTLVFSNSNLDEPMRLYRITGTYIVRGTR